MVLGQFTASVGPFDSSPTALDLRTDCAERQSSAVVMCGSVDIASRRPLPPTVLTGRVPFRLSRYAHALLLFFLESMAGFGGAGVMFEAPVELSGWCCDKWQEQTFFSVPPY